MTHLSPDQMSALADGALDPRARDEAERHLAGCPACRGAVAELRATDASLAPALAHDPGPAYFESFAARVEDRLRAGGLRGAQHRIQRQGGLAGWFRSPRRLATVTALATVVLAAGVVMWSRNEIGVPAVRQREMTTSRNEEAVPAPTTPPPVAVNQAPSPGPGATAQQVAPQKSVATTGGGAPATGSVPSATSPTAAAPQQVLARREAGATAGHMMEVRRDPVTGEDVPVQRGVTLPPAQAPQPSTEVGMLKRRAQPMGLAASGAEQAQDAGGARVCGTVRDNSGRGVANAQVNIAGTSRGATTDRSGAFCLDLPGATATLNVMAVGFQSKSTVVHAGSPMSVTLEAVPVLNTAKNLALRAGEVGVQSGEVASAFENLAAYPRSVARNAVRLTAVADKLHAAGGYDQAAAEWERLIPFVQGGPLEEEVRWQTASARVHAAQAGSTPHRDRAAVDALVAYIAKASPGPRHEEAQKWLDQLKR